MKRTLALFALAIIIVIIDQWSKVYVDNHFHLGESVAVIEGMFNFTYVRNPGAAFGSFGVSHPIIRMMVLRIIPVIACFYLIALLFKSKTNGAIINIAYALILGGAVGNLIDRFRLDYVIDMLDYYRGDWHFATFNVADTSISVAAGLLIIDYGLTWWSKRTK